MIHFIAFQQTNKQQWNKQFHSLDSIIPKFLIIYLNSIQGEGMTSIEPTGGEINDMCVFDESGLMLLALDTSQIPSYFLPALGPAPKWCSYMENLTVCLTNIIY